MDGTSRQGGGESTPGSGELPACYRTRLLGRYGLGRVLEVAARVRGRPVGGDEGVLSVLGDRRVVRALAGEGQGWERWRREGRAGNGGVNGGSTAPRDPVARSNLRTLLCAYPTLDHPQAAELTHATRDPSDRAHDVHDGAGMLVQAARLNGQARARRYPPAAMTSRGVAFDSAFDELYERQRWLDRELGGVAGVSYSCGGKENGGSLSAVALERAVKKIGDAAVPLGKRRNVRAYSLRST